jgi:hypothetical protein
MPTCLGPARYGLQTKSLGSALNRHVVREGRGPPLSRATTPSHRCARVQSLTKTALSAIPHRPMLTRLLNKLRERALRTGVCTAARQPGRRVAVPRCKAVNGRVQRSCATGMPSMDRRREAQAPDNTPDYRNCHHVPTSTIRVPPLNSRGGSIIIWPHPHQHWARPDHICARTSWTHHHHICARAWAHPCHICARAWAHPWHI